MLKNIPSEILSIIKKLNPTIKEFKRHKSLEEHSLIWDSQLSIRLKMNIIWHR